ncbi:MAG: hypothetical protein K2W96_01225 [Gemmataceae bacterium]|nr:hypothetical protein [Gemmataceae bacterium]
MMTVTNRLPGKAWRISLFGGTNAGKTCLLAALGMDKATDEIGATCRRLDRLPGINLGEGRWASLADGDPLKAFGRGNAVLGAAESALRAGRQTAATPPDAQPVLAVYRFTAPGGVEFHAEMLEYAGENIDRLLSEEQRAKALLPHLKEMDAVFVLAEAPHKNRPTELGPTLRTLRKAFDLLREGKHRTPVVALLLNKYDRRSPPAMPLGDRTKGARAFLDSRESVGHTELDRELSNVSAPDYGVFPVSAFGQAREEADGTAGTHEVPVPSGGTMASFGLEAPFLWAAKRLEERQAKERRERLTRGTWIGTAVAALLVAAWLVWEVVADRSAHAAHEAALQEKGDPDARQRAVDWFREYGRSGPWRHPLYFGLWKETARRIALEQHQSGHEGLAGLYDDALGKFELRLKAAREDAAGLRTLEKEIQAWQGVEGHEPDKERRVRRQRLMDEVGTALVALADDKRAEKDRQEVEKAKQAIKDGRIADAAKVLSHSRKGLKSARAAFPAQALARLEEMVSANLRSGQHDRALDDALETMNSPEVIELTDKAFLDRLGDLVNRIKTEGGKAYYDRFRANPTLDEAKKCLGSRFDQRKARIVKAYQHHLGRLDEPVEVTIQVSAISWGKWWHKYDNIVQVNIDGNNVILARDVKSWRNEESKDVAEGNWKVVVGKAVTLKVWVWCTAKNGLYTSPAGEAVYEGTVGALQGKTLELDGHDGRPAHEATVTIQVKGVPEAPPLPRWEE